MKLKSLAWVALMSLGGENILHAGPAAVGRGVRGIGQASRAVRAVGHVPRTPPVRIFRTPPLRSLGGPSQGQGRTGRSNFPLRDFQTERVPHFTSDTPRFRLRNVSHPLLFLGLGVGGGLTTLWWQDHPEEWDRLFSHSSPGFGLSPSPVCTSQDTHLEDVSRAVTQGGYLEVLREALFGPSQASKMDEEIIDFYNRPLFNDVNVAKLKRWFNEQSSEEASEVEEQEGQRGFFLSWLQKLSHLKDNTRLEQMKESTGLSEEEVLSLYMYTLDSDELNSRLRRGEVEDHFPKTIKATIDSALKKLAQNHPLPPETQLYRGTALPQWLFQQIREKKTFSDPAYLSTSVSLEASKGFFKENDAEREKVLFVIENPKSAVSIQPFSSYSEQDEVIFPPATAFQVKSMEKDESQGYWVIHLEEKK